MSQGTAVPAACSNCKTPLKDQVFFIMAERGMAYCPRCIVMKALKAAGDPQSIIKDAEALADREHKRLDLVKKLKQLEADRAEAYGNTMCQGTELAKRVWQEAVVNIDSDLDQVHHQLAVFDADRLDQAAGKGE